jgi:hypothetical protein
MPAPLASADPHGLDDGNALTGNALRQGVVTMMALRGVGISGECRESGRWELGDGRPASGGRGRQ